MKNNQIDFEKILVYLVFGIPVVHIIQLIIELFVKESIVTVTKYLILILILSYYLIIKNKIYLRSLVLPLLALILYNVFVSESLRISILHLLPLLVLINLTALFYSGRFKFVKISDSFKTFVFISIFVSFYVFIFGFENMDTDVYLGFYHSGLFDLPHKAAYYLLTIFMYASFIDKKMNVVYFLSLIGVFLTGVRSALIVLVIFFLFDLFFVSKIFEKKNRNKLIMFTVLSFILLLFIINFQFDFVSNVNSRLIKLINVEDADTYGGGRLAIGRALLQDVFSRNMLDFVLGKPVEQVFVITDGLFGKELWAHNDFTMVFFSLGLFGLVIYVYHLFISPIKYLRKNKDALKKGFIILFCVMCLAVFNGFYPYFMGIMVVYIIYLLKFRKEYAYDGGEYPILSKNVVFNKNVEKKRKNK